MLDPDARTLYTAALTPPPGFVLDRALASTCSLDPTTLLTVPIHLALLGHSRRAADDPVALLEAIRRTAQRITVYVDGGRIHVPAATHLLYGLLEELVVECRAPLGGSFHPKLWILRYVEPGHPGSARMRLLVLSRNLTADRCWDLALQLDGTPGGKTVAANRPLAELIRALPTLATGTLPKERQRHAELFAKEVLNTRWELPEGFDSLAFHVLGLDARPWKPPEADAVAVISPFLTARALRLLRERAGKIAALVSRPAELALLPLADRKLADKLFVLHEAVETEDGETCEQPGEVGLHAKAYIFECGRETAVVMGSANATTRALVEPRNVEVLAELRGPRRRVGGIAELFDRDELGRFLEPYLDERVAEEDADAAAAKQALDQARRALTDANLRVHLAPAGSGTWDVAVVPRAPVPLEGLASARSWLISLSPDSARDATPLAHKAPIALGPLSAASLTGLVAFELVAARAPTPLRFVLNLPVDGLPAERDAAIVHTVLRNREGFLRYLLFLLGGDESLPPPPAHAATGHSSWSGHTAAGHEQPLLEEMVRAFSREPGRLHDVRRLLETIARHGAPGETAIVPAEFMTFWRVFATALPREAP